MRSSTFDYIPNHVHRPSLILKNLMNYSSQGQMRHKARAHRTHAQPHRRGCNTLNRPPNHASMIIPQYQGRENNQKALT